jgi:transcriptional regulator with XRE-family HTH domain
MDRARAPYASLGRFLAERRIAAGFKMQSAFAKAIACTQQTVSRWEAGLSRPRVGQLPNLAKVLELDDVGTNRLLELAGYAVSPAVTAFDTPFPVERLSPESFERFVADLVAMLHPDADVNRQGAQGHDQAGTDVLATLRDGRKLSWQCKRVEQFGPQKVAAAIKKHTVATAEAYLALSSIASPAARAVVAEHAGWHMWDRDDISRLMRSLPIEAQRRLVRIYFRGQELALLGEPADRTWETPDEFFAALSNPNDAFNHEWPLVGREALIADFSGALVDPALRVVLLSGGGGTGKSRILKQVLSQCRTALPGWTPLLLTRDGEITKQGLDELGDRKLLLVVDDAHDRADLASLFEFSALHRDRVKLVLALRPYGVNHVKAQASAFSLVGPNVKDIELRPLTLVQSEQLAAEVLRQKNAPGDSASAIAQFTRDCPLATVMGAQVVAAGGIHPSVMHNEEVFRRTLLGRFESVIAGRFGQSGDASALQALLRFVALIQPIALDDERLLAAFGKLQNLQVFEVSRLMKALVQGGVLFQRGSRYRLAPDVLGDYLVEVHCVAEGGASSGYAEAVLDLVGPAYLENTVLNLGRMDWRRSDFQTDSSPLLDAIWRGLAPSDPYGDATLKAVKGIAYYQPRRALAFAESIADRKEYRDDVGEIARYAAYNQRHLARALDILWRLGRDDDRPLNAHPQHGIRVMAELAEPTPDKPKDYVEEILRFGLDLGRDPAAWTHHHSPFDFLKAILSTEGHSTESNGLTISFSPFFIDPEWSRDLRAPVIAFTVDALSDPDNRKAVSAAKVLHDALTFPRGMFGASADSKLIELWTPQFADTLRVLAQKVGSSSLDSLVKFEVGRAVAWLGGYGPEELAPLVESIRSLLTGSLDDRTDRVLLDGWGMDDRLADKEGHEERWAKYVTDLAAELEQAHPVAADLLQYLEGRLRRIIATHEDISGAHILLQRLMDRDPRFASAVVDAALSRPDSQSVRFAGTALARVLRSDQDAGRKAVAAYTASGNRDLGWAAGTAYMAQNYDKPWLGPEDEELLRHILKSEHDVVLEAGARAVRSLAAADPAMATRLIEGMNIPSAKVADELATVFEFGAGALPLTALTEAQVKKLLERLEPLPQLDGHWLKRFVARLSEASPIETADFFMRRVEAASVEARSVYMRPVNSGPWINNHEERLRFRKSGAGPALMRKVAQWMKHNAEQKGLFNYYARGLFEVMFGPLDEEVVGFLQRWLQQAQREDVLLIAGIVREAGEHFVFAFAPFVGELLARAKQIDQRTYELVRGELSAGAVTGARSGTPGQPFPQDLKMKSDAERQLAALPTYSAAYSLYENILRHAESSIASQLADGEELE